MNGQPATKVLVVDDDPMVLRAVRRVLQRTGYDVTAIEDSVEGLEAARDPSIDVALLDINMPNVNGMELLKAIKGERPSLEVIMMTAFGSVNTAVDAVKSGAFDYLTKPFDNIDDMTATVAKAAERKRQRSRARLFDAPLTVDNQFDEMVGKSNAMRGVFKLIDTVSRSSATVLIQGESGTGKELVAHAIHQRSTRKDKPLVSVNCSALAETLLESELFGHVKGAFTGAVGNKKGLFEAAHGGTIFLDEIGDISPATQVRLLRVIQEGEIKRVGSHESTHVDVRIIAATNADLQKAKQEGRFREDLYYRINVVKIAVPPLRERPEDIPLLAQHFLDHYAKKANKNVSGFTREAIEALTCASWSGNVRELENVVERAVILSESGTIEVSDLPSDLSEESQPLAVVAVAGLAHLPYSQAKRLAVRAFERRYLSTLLETHDTVAAAARAAGLDRSNFRRLMKQYGVLPHNSDKDDADNEPPVGSEHNLAV